MSLKAGIVGLPNVGVVTVPDTRLEYLEELYVPKSLVPTTFEFTDIAGLVKGASSGEGLGNKFLSHIREVDAIVEVVRCFDDENITHVEGKTDPIRDIEIINVELILADLEIIESRIEKIAKKAETTKDKDSLFEVATLNKAREALLANKPLRLVDFDEDEILVLKPFNFITLKPLIYAANVDEETAVTGHNTYTDLVSKYAENEHAGVIVMCAKMESELAELPDEDKKVFLEEMSITNSGLDKLIFATYDLLGLATYFTAGPDEVRAWTFKKGMNAKKCAGIIHSDFEKGFIKAEIMSFDDLKELGDEKKVKEAGKLRLEGKDYIMQDGDICYFRFNV